MGRYKVPKCIERFEVWGEKEGVKKRFGTFRSEAEADTYIGIELMNFESEGVDFTTKKKLPKLCRG